MKPLFCRLAVLLLLWPASGLTQAGRWEGVIEIRHGVKYVHNPRKGLWDNERSHHLFAEKVFSLGSIEATDEYLFGFVQCVAVDRRGNIYASDSQRHRVQVYDQEGRYVRTIGRKGQGPGELMRPWGVAMAKDGNLYVNDSLNRRISVFDSVGRFVRSFPVKGFPAEEIVVDSSGKVFVCNMPAMAQGQARGIVTMYDREGKRLRDLGEPLLLVEKGAYGRPYFAGSGLAMTRKEELIVWYTYPYLIHFYESGRLVKVIERADPAFQEPVVAETEFKALDGSVRRTRAVKIRCHLWKVLVLPQGHLAAFIQDYGPDYKNKPALSREFTTRIDLFDAEGRFLASFDWDWQQRGLLKHVDREGYFYSNCGSSGIVPGVTKWKVWFD